jgi:hypothetical protein
VDDAIKVVIVGNAVVFVMWFLLMFAKEREEQRTRAAYLAALNRIRAQIADDGARLRRVLARQEERQLEKEAREAKIRLDAVASDAGDAQARIDVSRLLDAETIDPGDDELDVQNVTEEVDGLTRLLRQLREGTTDDPLEE